MGAYVVKIHELTSNLEFYRSKEKWKSALKMSILSWFTFPGITLTRFDEISKFLFWRVDMNCIYDLPDTDSDLDDIKLMF